MSEENKDLPETVQAESGEHHHHHHHHHHHRRKRTKKAERKEKLKKIHVVGAICLSALLLVGLAIGLILSVHSAKGPVDLGVKNRVTYKIKDGEFSYTGNNIDKVFLQFGDGEELDENLVLFTSSSTAERYKFSYNFTYTMFVRFDDGSMARYVFEVNDNPVPVSLSEENGVITIKRLSGYRIDYLYYSYGLSLGDRFADYTLLASDTVTVQAFGNGWHTFCITATNDLGNKVYYVAVNVTGATPALAD